MIKDSPEISKYHVPLEYGQVYKFDKYDLLILRELDIDARKSLVELSKKVRLSRDAIRNRIKKLIDNKIILAFTPVYNPPKMGYSTINYVFISLYNPSKEQEEKFLEYLKSNKHVTYIASLIGKWDYILGNDGKLNPYEEKKDVDIPGFEFIMVFLVFIILIITIIKLLKVSILF